MERFVLVNCSVLLFIVILQAVISIPHNYETTDIKHDDEDTKSYLWFGPRLGRKKRNNSQANDEDIYRGYQEQEKDQFISLIDAIEDSPWAIVALNGKRRYSPRLGRESAEDLSGDRWLQDQDFTEIMSQRSPPFAPRLGRRLSTPQHNRRDDTNH